MLNDTQVKGAKPRAKDYTRSDDTGGRGEGRLMLRVRKNGTKEWLFQYQWQGKRTRLLIGKYPAITLSPRVKTEKRFGLVGNPVSAIPTQPDFEKAGDRVLSKEEIRALWEGVDAATIPLIANLVKLCLVTGQRVSELRRTKWKNVDIEEKRLAIPAEIQKKRRDHDVPLGPMADLADDITKLTLGNVQQGVRGESMNLGGDIVNFLRSYTPGSSLWYTRLGFERLLMDQLANQVDQNASDRFRRIQRRRAKGYNQDYFWRPGEATPQRAPDLTAVGGP